MDKTKFHKDFSSLYSTIQNHKIRLNQNHPCHPCSIARIKTCAQTVDLNRFV